MGRPGHVGLDTTAGAVAGAECQWCRTRGGCGCGFHRTTQQSSCVKRQALGSEGGPTTVEKILPALKKGAARSILAVRLFPTIRLGQGFW
jgi:sulfatase maturation enzyme AslB (radical SAM superfamily)